MAGVDRTLAAKEEKKRERKEKEKERKRKHFDEMESSSKFFSFPLSYLKDN
jgi:hypothetical protein